MSEKVSALPLYSQYFPRPSTQIEGVCENLKSEEGDFATSLSMRQADFSVQNKTWVDTAKCIVSTTLKVALFSYVLYPFAAPIIQRLAQGRIVQLLESNTVIKAMSQYYNNFSRTILTVMPKRNAELALKIFSSIWALNAALRYSVQRLIMIPLFPAQSRIVKLFVPFAKTGALNSYRKQAAAKLSEKGFIVRDVALQKNGVKYSGLLIGHKSTINNGQWTLQATGNLEPVEHSAELFALTYKNLNFNTLLINGPSVGRSEGQATPESIGDAQEVGLSFIETCLKADKIVIAGRSLGGAAIGQAILGHEFKKDVEYLVVRQMTFDSTSNISAKIIGQLFPRLEPVVAKVIQWAGCEMDSVAASKKLQELGIKEVIVQASSKKIQEGELPTPQDFLTDGPILAHASLGYTLVSRQITDNKVFLCLKNAYHGTHGAITAAKKEILQFSL